MFVTTEVKPALADAHRDFSGSLTCNADRMDLSVCIPALNADAVIGAQLRALASQEFDGSWEVIVADNGSVDRTRAVVETAARTFPVSLRVVDASSVRGVAHARNRAFAEALGQVVAFCDADDVVFPGWVAAASAAATRHAAVVGFNHEMREPLDATSPVINPRGVLPSAQGDVGYCGNFAIDSELLRAVGGFDERFVGYGPEDTDVSLRLLDAGHGLVAAEGMRIHYRLPSSSQRGLLSKRWSYASYEVLLWTLHPRRFPGQARLGAVLRELAGLPRRTIMGLRNEGAASLRGSAADVVVCVARLAGWWRFGRGSSPGE